MVSVDDEGAASALKRELGALRSLRHPHVISLLATCDDEDEGRLWALLEFAPHGSLHRLLHRATDEERLSAFGDVGTACFYRIAHEAASAMAFLHSRAVTHGDVKSANVLICAGGAAKLADFGLARVVSTSGFTRAAEQRGGTVAYMAPELLDGGRRAHDAESADVYALAVMYAEILTRKEPFADAQHDVTIALRVRAGERPALPKNLPTALKDLLAKCWTGPHKGDCRER